MVSNLSSLSLLSIRLPRKKVFRFPIWPSKWVPLINLLGPSVASVSRVSYVWLSYDLASLSPVNGNERGRGIGKSQKIAKEEAARQAFASMGWGPRKSFNTRIV